jgi:hypothetical protein
MEAIKQVRCMNAKRSWDCWLLTLRDGIYDLKVETVCTALEGPSDVNTMYGTPLVVKIHRQAPKLA